MILVTGGAFQGKYDFVRNRLRINDGWIDGAYCDFRDIYDCKAVQHFHEFVKRAIEYNKDITVLVDRLMEKNPDICILTNELGSGVVPTDQFDREYRDALGMICTQIAAKSHTVYRVICGIGMIIKKEDQC